MKKHTILLTSLLACGLGAISAHQAHAETINGNIATVQSGDTLSKIANDTHTTINQLASINGLNNPNLIYVGQQIKLNGAYNAVKAPVSNYQPNVVNYTKPVAKAPVTQNNSVKQAPTTNTTVNNQPHYQYVPAQVPTTMQSDIHHRTWNELSNQEKQAWQQPQPQQANNSGSVHDQFIANGGTQAMWDSIVIPESGGNPNAVNGKYHGLGQTDQASWGTGSVANQTQGMINYAVSRYGSINNAVAFRQAHGWW